MPCRDEGAWASSLDQARKDLDERTADLCALCKHVLDAGGALPGKVAAWWVSHEAADRKREASESTSVYLRQAAQARKIEDLGGVVSESMESNIRLAREHAKALIAKVDSPKLRNAMLANLGDGR